MADIPVGSLVEVSAGKGTVRFSGHTQFSQGKWIGVELSEPKGKNDGTVNGVAYFSCRLNYGVFVRASQVRVLEAPKEPATVRLISLSQPNVLFTLCFPFQTTSRPVHKRTPSINATPSLNRSTSMKSGLSTRSASPSKTMVPPAAPPQNRSTGPSPLSPPTSAASKRASQLQLGQSQNLTHLASTSQPPPSSRFPPRPPSSARETIPDSSPKLRPRITPDIPSSHSPAYAEPSSETIPPSPIVPSPTLPSSSPSISTVRELIPLDSII
jgi:dynactin 1